MVKKIKQAVMLAGGKGTRLRPLTENTLKPMVPVNGRPFFEYVVKLLQKNNFKEILFLLGNLPEQIVNYFGDGSQFGINMKYHWGDTEEQSGTRMKKAEGMIDDDFMVVYNDNYWPLNIDKLLNFHNKVGLLGTTVVYKNTDQYSKNNILVNEFGIVEAYDKSHETPGLNGVEIGFSPMNKKILEFLPDQDISFELGILPELVKRKNLAGFLTNHRYYTIGSLERFHQAEKFLESKKVIFLDRDGVINKKAKKADYIKKWDEFEFIDGAKEAIAKLTKNNYKIFIVSNQAGIARGMMTEEDLEDIHSNMKEELAKYGARIDGIYYCPHGWDEGCECRKPNPGMFYQAAREHYFNLTKTIFIGDDERDLQAGESADIKTYLVTPEKNLFDIVEHINP